MMMNHYPKKKEMLSPSEIKEIVNQIKNDNLKKNFAWQHLLDDISGGVWSNIPAYWSYHIPLYSI